MFTKGPVAIKGSHIHNFETILTIAKCTSPYSDIYTQ